jgi:hypothetical protein
MKEKKLKSTALKLVMMGLVFCLTGAQEVSASCAGYTNQSDCEGATNDGPTCYRIGGNSKAGCDWLVPFGCIDGTCL